jgi:hypothetical protein
MNEVHKDVLNKLKNRPNKEGKNNNDGVQLIKTLGKPDKKDIIKFILDNCKKDLPLTIQYMKISGSQWSKPNDSINYIKVSGDSLSKPEEQTSKDGQIPEIYFKVPNDNDLNETLDQIKSSSDIFNKSGPEDKFKKVTGDELKDVKKYFDDKEKGLIKPSGRLSLTEEVPEEVNLEKKDDEVKIEDNSMTCKVMGDGIERVDNGDDNFECIKISGDKLASYSKPENNEYLIKLKNLFKEANDDKAGVNYFYRKVKGLGIDKPDNIELNRTSKDDNVEGLYDEIKSKGDGLTNPEEGIQLLKVVGNINPNDINNTQF